MLTIKTILAPVDFSRRTNAEAKNAVNLANHFSARLIFAHVIPLFAEAHPTDPKAAEAYSHEFSSEIEQGVKSALESLSARVTEGLNVESIVLQGDPVEKIEEIVAAHNVDLIVMPTSGHGRFRRHLLGSVTSQVLHDLKVPVFTGLHVEAVSPSDEKPYRRIVALTGLDQRCETIVRWAADLAATYEAELHVVCVLPFLDTWGAPPSLPEPLRAEALAETRRRLTHLLSDASIEAMVTVLGGPIDRVLPPFLRESLIDVVVTGRRRPQDKVGVLGLHRDLMDTIQSAPCPTISV